MDEDVREAGKMAKRLFREVLTQGHGASLPSALSDAWLQRANESCEKVFADLPDGPASDPETVACTMLTMLVMKTLHDRGGVDLSKQGVPIDELQGYMQLYFIEVQLEGLRRNGLVRSNPATLDDIFDRNRMTQYSGPFIDALCRGGDAREMN